jgi:metacaspase-1
VKQFENGRALVIGISNYTLMPKLPAVVLNDASDMFKVLTSDQLCGYPAANVRSLTDGEATADAIRRALVELAASARPDDTVIFVFSGHGEQLVSGAGAGSYICPVNFDVRDLKNTAIARDELTGLLGDIKCARLTVVLDACHAAGTVDMKTAVGAVTMKAGLSQSDIDVLGSGTGRVVLASSRPDEPSLILGGMRNSLFTHHLLDSFRGAGTHRGDGMIRILDVFHHVSVAVQAQGPQHPVMKTNDLQDNFAIARSPTAGAKGGPAPNPSADDWWKKLERAAVALYPEGPTGNEVWSRAGGDVAALKSGLTGTAAWHLAIKLLSKGGGGLTPNALLSTMQSDFPKNPPLARLLSTTPPG